MVPLERNLYQTPTSGTSVGRTVRGSSVGTWTGKSTVLCMSVCSSKNSDYSYRYAWMTSKWLEAEDGSNVEETDETGRSWRTNIILDHVYLGCTQRDCKPNETIIHQYREMFESRISAKATEKLGWGTLSRKDGGVVLRHGRTCSKML